MQLARTNGLKQSLSLVITGGNYASLVGKDWSVPKALLVGELRSHGIRSVLASFAIIVRSAKTSWTGFVRACAIC